MRLYSRNQLLDILFTMNHPENPNLVDREGRGRLHAQTAWVLRKLGGLRDIDPLPTRFGEARYDYTLACVLTRTIEEGYAYTWDLD